MITEEQFLNQIIDYAQLCGWKLCHFRPAKTEKGWRTAIQGDIGYPDLTLARRPRVIFAEIKSEKGKLTQEQYDWLELLTDCMQEVYLWKPEDFNRITEILR